MSKIYLPTEYLKKPCYVINNGYIRVYDTVNTNRDNVVHDIYVNQDYMIKETRANYTSNTVCDKMNTYTDDVLYRTDFMNFIVSLSLLCLILIYFPVCIVFKIIRKGK